MEVAVDKFIVYIPEFWLGDIKQLTETYFHKVRRSNPGRITIFSR
jgi:hypothetical protein